MEQIDGKKLKKLSIDYASKKPYYVWHTEIDGYKFDFILPPYTIIAETYEKGEQEFNELMDYLILRYVEAWRVPTGIVFYSNGKIRFDGKMYTKDNFPLVFAALEMANSGSALREIYGKAGIRGFFDFQTKMVSQVQLRLGLSRLYDRKP